MSKYTVLFNSLLVRGHFQACSLVVILQCLLGSLARIVSTSDNPKGESLGYPVQSSWTFLVRKLVGDTCCPHDYSNPCAYDARIAKVQSF